MILTQEQVNRIIDLMRMDSNNFNDFVSKAFRDLLIKHYGLTQNEIATIENNLSEAYRNIYDLLC